MGLDLGPPLPNGKWRRRLYVINQDRAWVRFCVAYGWREKST